MSDSVGSTPAPPLKKKSGVKPWMIAAIAVVVVVALIAVVVLSPSTTANALEKVQKRGKLIVGTNVPYPPFETYNLTSQQCEGVDMDIVKAIAAKLGVDVEFQRYDFDALIGAVQAGTIDMAISSFTITEERAKSIDFSHPYYYANQTVLVHDGSTIAAVEDLYGKNMTAQVGTTGAYWIEDNLVTPGHVTVYDPNTEMINAILMVENGQKDACVLDSPIGDKFANDPSYHMKIAFTIPTDEQYGIVCPKNQPELLNAVNQALDQMKADGTLQAIMDKWL